MEDSRSRSPGRGLHPRHRPPLKCRTYGTLSRILSMFDDRNEPPRLVKFAPCQLSPGSLTLDDFVLNNVARDADIGKKGSFSEEKGGVVDESFEGVGLSGRGPSETQMSLEEIVDIMSIDEDGDGALSKQKENMAERGGTQVVSLEDNGCNPEQMIVDELKAILDGDVSPLQDNNSVEIDAASLEKTLCVSGIVELENKQEQHSVLKESLVNESTGVTLMLQDGEQLSQNGSERLCSSPARSVLAAQPNERKESKSMSFGNNMSAGEVVVENNDYVATSDINLATIPMDADEVMEEGELSEGSEVEVTALVCSENPQLPDENLGDGQLSKVKSREVDASSSVLDVRSNVSDGIEVKVKGTDGANVVCKDDLDSYGNAKRLEAQGIDRCESFTEDGRTQLQQAAAKDVGGVPTTRPTDLVFYGDILGEHIADERLASEKPETDVQKKRKRGPGSKERKERKKAKERMKRAQKNRELGVTRLKLEPVQQKPKPMLICRHYIRGRCQEGEKCKFSHDTVPLTKSTPCSYFARRTCMKGDDCPFDHELSKYPCSNFVSKGFCIRGDSCLFSHKILQKEDLATSKTNSSGPVKPSDARTKKRPDTDGASGRAAGAVLESLGISCKSMDQMIASSYGKAPVQKSNLGLHPVKNLAMASPVASGCGNLSLKEKNEGMLSNQAKESPSSGSLVKSNEIVKTPVAPKGINFLSFGRSSSDTTKTGVPKSDSAIPDKRVTTNAANETLCSVESQELKNAVAVHTPQTDPSTSRQATTPSLVNNPYDGSAQGADMKKFENSSMTASKLPTFPVTSRQQAGGSTPSPYKSISSSAQKALSSTLAFAARCEKEMVVKNRSTGDQASCSTTSKETTGGADQNDTVRAMKILDFLSSIGKKK